MLIPMIVTACFYNTRQHQPSISSPIGKFSVVATTTLIFVVTMGFAIKATINDIFSLSSDGDDASENDSDADETDVDNGRRNDSDASIDAEGE